MIILLISIKTTICQIMLAKINCRIESGPEEKNSGFFIWFVLLFLVGRNSQIEIIKVTKPIDIVF